MLDLSQGKVSIYEIKMPDKTILRVKLPTQRQLIALSEIALGVHETSKAIDTMYEMLTECFNRNENGITYTKEAIEEMIDLKIAIMVLEDFLGFVTEQLKN